MERIRQLKEGDDLTDLIDLSREFFAEYEAYHEALFDVDSLADKHISDYFTRTIGSASDATFVAIVDEQVAGYITVHIRPQAAFYRVKESGAISGLMVGRRHRRLGIATRLLARGQAFFKAHGIRYFTVYTAVANQAGLRFYEANGMVPLQTTLVGEID
jgi:ribosomal protein S18 acetylase RimI-like enzyme